MGKTEQVVGRNGSRYVVETTRGEEVINLTALPRHVAIIMDGNGRWARQRGLRRNRGHREGVNSFREIVRVAGELGIEVLTLYAFSYENWARPRSEVNFLMRLLVSTIDRELDELHHNNVRFNPIGRLANLPKAVQREIHRASQKTAGNDGLLLNMALSYGGRQEIVDGLQRVIQDIQVGRLKPEELDDTRFSHYLYTALQPDPDLLIRTGGEMRISNFLLWQMAYTEIVVTPVFWPDFRRRHFYEAIVDYQGRERRFGRLADS